MRGPRAYQNGMTLVEVLVAMAILAGVAGAVLLMTAQSARLGVSVEQKLLARIVADNAAIETFATNARLERTSIEPVEFAGRKWRVERQVNETTIDGLMQLSVSVSLDKSDQVLARVETIKAQLQ